MRILLFNGGNVIEATGGAEKVDGINGFLSDNASEDFAAKLKLLMDNQNLRVKMGRLGHEMMKQYAPEKVWNQWDNLITEVVQQHRQRRAT